MSSELLNTFLTRGLMTESVDGAYEQTGFHHSHRCAPHNLVEVGALFRDGGFFLEMITCLDLRETDSLMRMVYTFNRFEETQRHRLHIDLEIGVSVPSLVSSFAAANWFEREVYDMYGIVFEEHPDLKRILLPDDADFFPLLKDFGRIDEATEVQDEAGEGEA
jgi:NADH-quinone oxidoreductase subunit C